MAGLADQYGGRGQINEKRTQRLSRRLFLSLRAACNPRGLLAAKMNSDQLQSRAAADDVQPILVADADVRGCCGS